MNSPVPVPVDDWSAERGELHGQMVKWLRKGGLIDALCSWPWVTLCVVLGAIATLRFVTEHAAPAARADAAMEELLTEEQAERAKGPAPSKSSKKKQKSPSVAAPAPPPAAVLKPAASDAKRAEAALRVAIAGGGLSALEAALAAASREVREGGVGAEARARCSKLLEAQQEAELKARQ